MIGLATASTCTNWNQYYGYRWPRCSMQGGDFPQAPHAGRTVPCVRPACPKGAQHVILHTGPRQKCAAAASTRCNPAAQAPAVAPPYRIPSCGWHRARYGRPAHVPRSPAPSTPARRRNAAGNGVPDDRRFVIDLGNRLHHPRRSGHIDLPHAVKIQHSRPYQVQHEGQVITASALDSRNRRRAGGRILFPKIHAFEAQRKIGRWGRHIHANHVELAQLRQQAVPQNPEIPVTTTVGFASPIYLGPDGGAFIAGFAPSSSCMPASGAVAAASAKYFSFTPAWLTAGSSAAHPACAASAGWMKFQLAPCPEAECLFPLLCTPGIRWGC